MRVVGVKHVGGFRAGRWLRPGLSQRLTLGGLVVADLGRFAEVGDTVEVETAHVPGVEPSMLRFEVLELDGRRVELVKVSIHPVRREEPAHEASAEDVQPDPSQEQTGSVDTDDPHEEATR